MRYYPEDERIQVRMGQATFPYGYEVRHATLDVDMFFWVSILCADLRYQVIVFRVMLYK